jgi:Rrf2 family iron-sulfur cluster assembly transcriptional regulator
MSLIFSRECEYAIQSLLYLALKKQGERTSIRELAQRLNIPYHFLGKILQRLAHKGLLVSHRGIDGGFALSMPPEEITLFHVVEAVDGVAFTHMCVLGFSECSQEKPCAVHEHWSSLREGIYQMLIKKNIAAMARDMRKPEYQNIPAVKAFYDTHIAKSTV